MEIKLDIINDGIVNHTDGFIQQCESDYYKQVRRIADYIHIHHATRPIILLAGPSGSGKTTTAKLLESMLDREGLETHTVSMDNYFKTLSPEQIDLAQNKQLDLESPDRMDTCLLNTQLRAILEGRTVELPTFDFINSKSLPSGQFLTRRDNELVIFEGIHALNPDVIRLPDENTVRIYISVRTRIVCPDENRLHPSRIRLMRRMLRDQGGRGRSIAKTLAMFESVEEGAARYILPYKPHALFDIDTLIPYEIGLYRDHLLPLLAKLEEREQVADIIDFLTKCAPLDTAAVPDTSLLQEFIPQK